MSIRARPEPRQSGPDWAPTRITAVRAPHPHRRGRKRGQEMGVRNGSRFWISGWWRKILLPGIAGWFPCPGLGSAGPDRRAQGSSKEEERRSRCARGIEWIASSACSGPVPLPPGLPEGANWPPITPRFSPQAGNPGYLPAGINARDEGFTPIAFPKFGNRSLTLSPDRQPDRHPSLGTEHGRNSRPPSDASPSFNNRGLLQAGYFMA
jgi:hypothetical protein